MHPILNIAMQAIRKAGNFIIKQYEFFGRNNIRLPNYIQTFLNDVRNESNQIISTIIKKFYPSHIIIDIHNTHTIMSIREHNQTYWIIDSIDSDINFSKQFPFLTLSIAVQQNKNIEIGVIYDPIHNELFSACRGKGARFNNYHRIRLYQNNNIFPPSNNFMFTAISCDTEYTQYNNRAIRILNKLHNSQSQMIMNFRCTGSVNLDLIYVSMGRTDGCFILSSNKNIKLISSVLILKESGGIITDFEGNNINDYLFNENVIAGHPKLIKKILPLIKKNI
ncbi:Inositol-1-monophosphatase [Candidatus Blochmanniella vafra str. BVAF]|uniref:Inositol-1-monophosphatase n=1 Tax=Blochmanniella vafra (strain BVAF) TaxID=859654 RepID=E8Q6F0_BLOVB|nr:inositol monophosphatase family protein [Candidatus Blochmannia vafer]ADV33919.1 Inositol-1-monophosphatase [Candidatus Blochmannia vafer str. BVAF]